MSTITKEKKTNRQLGSLPGDPNSQSLFNSNDLTKRTIYLRLDIIK